MPVAFFSESDIYVFLHSFTTQKWLALGLLSVGVALVQIPAGKELQKDEEDLLQGKADVMLGLIAVLMACCTSAFSGVYFERILKKKVGSLWLRNVQLGFFGILLGLFAAYGNDGKAIAEGGFFQYYTADVWIVVLLQVGAVALLCLSCC